MVHACVFGENRNKESQSWKKSLCKRCDYFGPASTISGSGWQDAGCERKCARGKKRAALSRDLPNQPVLVTGGVECSVGYGGVWSVHLEEGDGGEEEDVARQWLRRRREHRERAARRIHRCAAQHQYQQLAITPKQLKHLARHQELRGGDLASYVPHLLATPTGPS